jgi:hypothetical protein
LDIRFDLILDARLEYLALALGNAKSHSVAVGGLRGDAISLLTEPEEELEVVQAQLELYHTLSPRINEGGKDHIPDNKAASTSQSELTVFPLPFILDWVTRVLTEWPVLISAAALPRAGRTLRFGHYEIPHLSRMCVALTSEPRAGHIKLLKEGLTSVGSSRQGSQSTWNRWFLPVSEHRDDNLVRLLWSRIFDESK